MKNIKGKIVGKDFAVSPFLSDKTLIMILKEFPLIAFSEVWVTIPTTRSICVFCGAPIPDMIVRKICEDLNEDLG